MSSLMTTMWNAWIVTVFLSAVPMTSYGKGPGSVRLAVIAPMDSNHEQSLVRILPAIELAVRRVSHPETGTLPDWDIKVDYRDSNCSSTLGPLAAFDFYINKSANAFLGPVCEYVIGPVARYSSVWHIPVLTAGGLVNSFDHKATYQTLTRVMGSYRHLGEALRHLLSIFNWHVVGLLYHNYDVSKQKGNSVCHFTLGPVFTAFNQTPAHRSFDQDLTAREDYIKLLQFISKSARRGCLLQMDAILNEQTGPVWSDTLLAYIEQ